MAMGTDHITVTTAAEFIPEIWSRETLRAMEDALVMSGLVKRYDAEVSAKGDTLHIPEISNLTANEKSAETAVTLQAVSESSQTLSIDKHYEVSFTIEDIVKTQSAYDLRTEYTSKAGYALAEQVDTDLLALYSSLTSTDVGTYGNDITDAVIVAAMQALDEVNAPIENRQFVIAPSQKAALLKLDKFVKADYLGEVQKATPVKKGPNSRFLWGDIYGNAVYYTNQVPETSATPTQTHNVFFHKEAFALGMQKNVRTQAQYKLDFLSNLIVSDVLYGVACIRSTFGVEVRS
jgi:hypothetical protein